MPIYEYRCNQGHDCEFLLRVGEEPAACPECGLALTRRWSTVNVNYNEIQRVFDPDYVPRTSRSPAKEPD